MSAVQGVQLRTLAEGRALAEQDLTSSNRKQLSFWFWLF